MSNTPRQKRREDVTTTVAPLAQNLLARMAGRKSDDSSTEAHHLAILREAALSCSHASCMSACDMIREDGVSYEDIVDCYIPAVARTLGIEWAEDHISFVKTSVGTAMLQWMVGALERTHLEDDIPTDSPGILVVVPAGEHHTLGAVLLSSQLRRQGVYVNLLLQARAEDFQFPMRRKNLHATMISASPRCEMREIRQLVTASRHVTEERAPVLIGGTIAEVETDLIEHSGADHVASDVVEALRLCEITAP